MNLQKQIRTYRNQKNISQEELADLVYVSRQTISNWETGKSYPDIHSLLLLGTVFGVSLDELVKGDLDMIKQTIASQDHANFEKLSKLFSILMLTTMVSIVPLNHYLNWYGFIVWGILAIVTFVVALQVEKEKKKFNIQSLREIVAFMNGETLDNVTKAREDGKRNYQKAFLALASALITMVIAFVFLMIFKKF